MLRSENVATPFTIVTVFVPESVPGRRSPPLCAMAIVTGPVKAATVLPRSSTAVPPTGGVIGRRGNVVLGWTVKTRCGRAGLSANTVASHVLGELKYQVHWGSTVPALAWTVYSPSITSNESDPMPMSVNPGGGVNPVRPFVIVTACASAPAPSVIAPGSAVVIDEPAPTAERCAPRAWAVTASTPLYAVSCTPPSRTGVDVSACTARTWPGSVLGSGKPCTLVAT